MFMACQSYDEAKVTSKQELYDKSSVYVQWRVRKSNLVAKGGNDRNLGGHKSYYSRAHIIISDSVQSSTANILSTALDS